MAPSLLLSMLLCSGSAFGHLDRVFSARSLCRYGIIHIVEIFLAFKLCF